MNYSLKHIADICHGKLVGADSFVDSIMTDSRHSYGKDEKPLFFAIKGQNHDGHNFIAELYRRGVRSFVVESEIEAAEFPDAGFVCVQRSLYALQALAADYRSHFKGKVVAITGSSGKTTVKEWIAQMVPDGMTVFRSPRSYNSQIGVPVSLLMMHGKEDMAVIEAGISRPGEMQRLADMIRADIGIFTTLSVEHQENFLSIEQKLAEKLNLFETCETIIYNSNEAGVERTIKERYPAARLVDSTDYLQFTEGVGDEFSRANASLVLVLYDTLGIEPELLRARLDALQQVALRIDLREGLGDSIIVSDKSNTDINSLAIALNYLTSVAAGRPKMLVISDILYSSLPDDELYARVASMVESAGVEYVIGVGEKIKEFGHLFACGKEFYPTPGEFLKMLNQTKISGYAVLVKGNHASGFKSITHQMERKSHTTVLEISLDAMIHNLNYFRAKLPAGTKLMAMVKASGYGNGDFEVANMLQSQGVDYLAVAFADEGVALREQGISMPIVVLNADSDSFGLMIANRLEPEIYNFTSLKTFVAAVKDSAESAYPIHIKIDSGMHRLGFESKDIDCLVEVLHDESSSVVMRSIFSHLAVADMPCEDNFTLHQISLFDDVSRQIMNALPHKPLRHIANSAAQERFPQATYDMCRLGIGLYGVSCVDQSALKPVSRMITRIVQVKELDSQQTVGYGREGRLTRTSRVATIPVGYADGLDRHLGNGRWEVMVEGRRAPIIGRICMDSCMIDVTGMEVAEGDEVTVFGGGAGNSVQDMADVLGTIPYEVMTSISERVKRIYIKE